MLNFGKFSMDKATVIRTIILLVALANQFLVSFGLSPFPFSAEQIEVGLSWAFTVLATLWTWWKNNSITKEARQADEYMHELKTKNKRKKGDN